MKGIDTERVRVLAICEYVSQWLQVADGQGEPVTAARALEFVAGLVREGYTPDRVDALLAMLPKKTLSQRHPQETAPPSADEPLVKPIRFRELF